MGQPVEQPGMSYARSASTWYALAVLLAAGFAAGLAQVVLMRELLVVAYGNELSMGLLLACWLLAGALGSLVGRRASLHLGAPRLARTLIGLCALPGPLLIIAVALVRIAPLVGSHIADLCMQQPRLASIIGWLALRPGEMLSLGQMMLLGGLAALGPAALDGAQFAVGIKLYGMSDVSRRVMGAAYAADAVGHLIGGVLLATSVVVLLDPFSLALVAALVNALAALSLLRVLFRASPGRLISVGVLVALLLAACAIFTPRLDTKSLQWRWYNHELLASYESIYGNIAIMRQEPDGIYLYQSGVYSGASPPLVGTIDELVHFTMLQHPRPERVLLIGGGITGGLREILKYQPEKITYVELDATLLRLAERWAAPEDVRALRDSRVRVVVDDGRRYLGGVKGADFDVIIIALPDPATAQLNRFYTTEFYATIAQALADGGVVGWQIPGSEGYFGPELAQLHTCLLATAREHLPNIARMPGESTVCVGGRGAVTEDATVLLERLAACGIEAPYFEGMLPERLRPSTLHTVKSALSNVEPPPRNTDLRPVGYFFDQTWWLTQLHPSSGRLLERIGRLRMEDILAPVAGICALLAALMWLRPVASGVFALTVTASGFASMSLEVALLFAFQAFYGYVYHMVGVIIGAFMVGVALGALGADKWLKTRDAEAERGLLFGLGFIAATAIALGGILPVLGGSGQSQELVVFFPFVTAVVGLAVGAVFPLASRAASADATAHAAAGLYAADLVGAAAGAILAGAFLVPVLGLMGTCTIAAVVVGAAGVLIVARWLLAS